MARSHWWHQLIIKEGIEKAEVYINSGQRK